MAMNVISISSLLWTFSVSLEIMKAMYTCRVMNLSLKNKHYVMVMATYHLRPEKEVNF
jgi:hypothetical protein